MSAKNTAANLNPNFDKTIRSRARGRARSELGNLLREGRVLDPKICGPRPPQDS